MEPPKQTSGRDKMKLCELENIVSMFIDIVIKNHPDVDKHDLAYILEEVAKQIREGVFDKIETESPDLARY
jgi:hypothetical protein